MRRYTDINYYALLGVMSDASRDEIRAAYRVKVRTAHPDKGGDPELFAQVAEAWEVLGNEAERAIYDADRKLRMRAPRPYQQAKLRRDDAPASAASAASDGRTPASTPGEDARKQWLANKRRL